MMKGFLNQNMVEGIIFKIKLFGIIGAK